MASIENDILPIVEMIHADVARRYSKNKSREENDTALLELVQTYIFDFKKVVDGVGELTLNQLCEEYPGFYLFSDFMERFAQATRDGTFSGVR